MQGNIQIALGEIEHLKNDFIYRKQKTDKFNTIYLILKSILDSQKTNKLFSTFSNLINVPIAVIDIKGNVLSSSNWQSICINFHRKNILTCERCIQSDIELANSLKDKNNFTMYNCKNGLTDCASPIIIEGQHIANLFIGQFLRTTPDKKFFNKQAEKFGFDKTEYFNALKDVPIINERKSKEITNYLTNFAELLASMTYEKYLSEEKDKVYTKTLEKKNKELEFINKNLEEIVKKRTKKLEFLASHDTMTGIYNRRRFFKEYKKIYDKNDNTSISMIDIDKFKLINDTYGHPMGDEVIKSVTKTIKENLDDCYTIGRLGGEEFAIVCGCGNINRIEKVNKKVKNAIENLEIITDKKDIIKLTISIGVAYKNSNTKSIDELIKRADIALYEAKKTGRNKVIYK